ncbi:fungal-specific transcription factor domain-containing protein [Ilyonectria sp. MPI-CAGE-AT-0026]|nr:fungal-specific transcription factor domain-containing protein [Ilyonectria sp. MPI-CAGE-AT-0026]
MSSSSNSAGTGLNPRKRNRTACTRCQRRKQKCDDQLPSCSNCLLARARCDKSIVANETFSVAYTKALEDRVASLEIQLAQSASNSHSRQLGESAQSQQHERLHQPTPSVGVGMMNTPSPATTGDIRRPDALSEVVDMISMGNFEAPAYVGPSAGLSLALNLGEMVQATVWKEAIPSMTQDPNSSPIGDGNELKRGPEDHVSTPGAGHKSHLYGPNVTARAMTMEEIMKYGAKEPPDESLGSRILNAYLLRLHPRYPFLDPAEVWELHRDRADLTSFATAAQILSRRFKIFKLYMVYAIGSTLLQLTDNVTVSPESFYMTALQHIAVAKEGRTVHNVEAMTLLVIYHLRSASGHGLWYMIGLAMRTCIDLGMHRKGYEQGQLPSIVHKRRRLFWTVYSLERTIAISLGRPLSIAERDIDVELPEAMAEDSPSSTRTTASPPMASVQPTEYIQHAIFLFQLRRIESRIYHSIYRADKSLTALRPKLDHLYQTLEEWRASLTKWQLPDCSMFDYLMLHYFRAVRMLVQPFLTLLQASDPYYALCLRAAGDICQTHKRLHQTLDYGHSFIAVQTVFVAGVTLLYGLWTQANALWSVSFADDVRACSLVLFVMGERASWVRKYRDAFEILVGAAMEKLRMGEAGVMGASRNQSHGEQRQAQDLPHEAGVNSGEDRGAGTHSIGDMLGSNSAWSGGNAAMNGEDGDAWRVVMELAHWIDRDDEEPLWMPNFEHLQNLSG